MLNQNSIWRYLLVIIVLGVSMLYALPNLYPNDPSLQINATRGADVTQQTVEQLQKAFTQQGLTPKSAVLEKGQVLVRFLNTEDQLKAREVANDILGDNFVTALNLAPATPAWLDAIGAAPMKLGLDLRGGVHFLMEVDMKTAMEKNVNDLVLLYRTDLREAKVRYRAVTADVPNLKVNLSFRSAEDLAAAKTLLSGKDRDMTFTEADDLTLVAAFSEIKIKALREDAVAQNITIIRNRVNAIGVAEPLVQRQGAERIVVQLPGVQDTARAKEILGATATLEFRMVDEAGDLQSAIDGRVPPNAQLYNDRQGRPVLLQKRVMLTGNHIIGANSSFDEYSRPQVNIDLDAKGGNTFSQATKEAIGKQMATVFIEYKPTDKKDAQGRTILEKKEEVINVATIQARLGRSFRITGVDSPAEAQNLALLLRAGALIAPIQIVEERTIGPSLGQENIELGTNAIMVGMLLTVIFMAVYYKGVGMVANVALASNVVLLIGVLSMVPGATLTLPGMAGILLTIGMAIDANVLINERIREELANGRSVQQAIHEGYNRAFATITDSNITTFLVAIILFGLGSGPVKGFAVTLALGIITSIFTAVTVSRLFVNLIWGGRKVEKLPI
ncbi:protein translocase subunit SecD [Rheinheimera tangshanensis]|uniref:Protein translocase subunit SecD n=1 Tax=Rheinheimera tangshanensis TaxID=400153 RepID=A0A5C8LZT7_9GAMM|nr:protein translocase subunit SecD [Rheinheimera tangshanensis]MBP8227982.1 protein translocase subunit SecD [Rheinheimera sp.]TXK81169.1 protein translocase subunit SecD [Rheinheimera tangshanensis]GGM58608.1 protein translocase subunit SecD [Rheinheimera tangshanensis]